MCPSLACLLVLDGGGVCVGFLLDFRFCSAFLCQVCTARITVASQCGLKSGGPSPPAPFLFLKIALPTWGLLCSHTNFKIFCSRCAGKKNAVHNLIRIASSLSVPWDGIVILAIVMLPVQGHGKSLHLFTSSLIPSSVSYSFQGAGLLPP